MFGSTSDTNAKGQGLGNILNGIDGLLITTKKSSVQHC